MIPQEELAKCKVVASLTDEQLEKVAALCSPESYGAGAVIFQSGSMAQWLYVVVSGRVALQLEVPGTDSPLRKRVTVDVLRAHDLLGWSGLTEPYIYTLTAVCLQASTVLSIDAQKLSTLIQEDSAIGIEVLQNLNQVISSRLSETRQLLVAERSLV